MSSTGNSTNIDLSYGLDAAQGITLYGAAATHAGYSVSGVGDVNNDGVDDFIVGVPLYNSTVASAFLIFGNSSGMPSSFNLAESLGGSGIQITIPDAGGLAFSIASSAAGDVNGDGIGDFILGASSFNETSGVAYVVYGGNSLSDLNMEDWNTAGGGNAGFVITSCGSDSLLGRAVGGAGDVNGDGFADVLVGAPRFNDSAGVAFLVYGSAAQPTGFVDLSSGDIDSGAGVAVSGTLDSFTGASVGGAGDVNGDGFDDFLVGSPYFGSYDGLATLVLGSVAPISMVVNGSYTGGGAVGIVGPVSAQVGSSVGAAGDVNGDGFDDYLVGAPYANSGNGLAYLLYGGTNAEQNVNLAGGLSNGQGVVLQGVAGEQVGFSVAAAGDSNGDGFDDVVVGAPYFNQVSGDGAAYVLFGGTRMAPLYVTSSNLNYSGFTIKGAGGEQVGFSVGGGGDVNGDGYADVLVGAPYYTTGDGVAYAVYGGPSLTAAPSSMPTETPDGTISSSTGGFFGSLDDASSLSVRFFIIFFLALGLQFCVLYARWGQGKPQKRRLNDIGSMTAVFVEVILKSAYMAVIVYYVAFGYASASTASKALYVIGRMVTVFGVTMLLHSAAFVGAVATGHKYCPRISLVEMLDVATIRTWLGGVAYGGLSLLCVVDLTAVRMLPWLATDNTHSLGGYPTVTVMRLCLYATLFSQLLQVLSSVLALSFNDNTSDDSTDTAHPGFEVLMLIVCSLNALSNGTVVMYTESVVQAADPGSILAIVPSDADKLATMLKKAEAARSAAIEVEAEAAAAAVGAGGKRSGGTQVALKSPAAPGATGESSEVSNPMVEGAGKGNTHPEENNV